MTKCTYCNRDAIAPDIITPPLCTRHHDIAILISRAQRFNLAITPATLTDLMQRATARNWAITAADIPQLMQDLHQ